MKKRNLIFLLGIMLLINISGVLSYSLFPRPYVDDTFYPSTQFNFNFSFYDSSNNLLLFNESIVTTDTSGVAFVNFSLNFTSVPTRFVHYRNDSSTAIYDGVFDSKIYNKIYVNDSLFNKINVTELYANGINLSNANNLFTRISNFQTYFDNNFSAKTTDDLTQGTTNLYNNKTWNQSYANDLFVSSSNTTILSTFNTTYDSHVNWTDGAGTTLNISAGGIKVDHIAEKTNGHDVVIDNDVDLGSNTLTAEQLTSTDDITMQGDNLNLGNIATGGDITISFSTSGNSGSILYDESGDEFDFGGSKITTTDNIDANFGSFNGVGITGNNDLLFTTDYGTITLETNTVPDLILNDMDDLRLDPTTYLRSNSLNIGLTGTSGYTFNKNSNAGGDFIWQSDNNASALFMDAGNEVIKMWGNQIQFHPNGTIVAYEYVDLTPAFEGTSEEALNSILEFDFYIDKNGDRQINHSTLDDFVRVENVPIYNYTEMQDCENSTKEYIDENNKTIQEVTEVCDDYTEVEIIGYKDGRDIGKGLTLTWDAMRELEKQIQDLNDRVTQLEISTCAVHLFGWCLVG